MQSESVVQRSESEGITLRQAYERYVERDHRDAGKPESTLREYRSAIRQAERFCAEWQGPTLRVFGSESVCDPSKYRSHRPILLDVDRDWLRDFRDWQRDRRRVSAITVNKRVATISAIVAACAREGIVERIPRLAKLPCERANKKLAFTSRELDALYRACRLVTWPSGSELSVVRWKTAIVLFATYGSRCQDVVSHEACKPGLRWESVRSDPVCPEDDAVTWEHGWLRFRQAKTGGLVCAPLTAEAARHLRLLRGAGDDPQSRVIDFPLSPDGFYKQWGAIRAAAAKAAESDRLLQADVHNFRDTATTVHNRVTPQIAAYFTGHAQGSVSEVHYNLPFGALCDHLRRFGTEGRPAWPEAFADALPVDLTTRQLRLF
jgi:integrase